MWVLREGRGPLGAGWGLLFGELGGFLGGGLGF